nr:GNAT family N-acetyltransferase [Alkalicoccus halolimnae]
MSSQREKFQVRTAVPMDAERILSFTRQIFVEAPYLLTTPDEFHTTYEEEREQLEQSLKEEAYLCLLAEYKGEMIGLLDFQNGNRRRTRHHGTFGMSVGKEFRNKGVGRALLTSLLQWVDEHPFIEKVSLEVFEENESAVALYEKFHFQTEGRHLKAVKTEENIYHHLLTMAYFKRSD